MGLKGPSLDKVTDGIDQISVDFERILKQKVGVWARKVKAEQEMRVPVGQYQGGALRGGQREKRTVNNNILNINFSNVEPYAGFVELGTGPRGMANKPTEIPESIALVYRDEGWVYFDEKLQKFFFTYGLPARQFFYPPIFKHLPELKQIIKDSQREAVKRYLQSKK